MGGHIEKLNPDSLKQKNGSLFHDIRVEHTLLLQIMRNRILRQKRRLQPDFSSNPLALTVRRIRRMIASPAAPELWAEVRALDLVELLDLAPSFVADGSGYVNFQTHDRHRSAIVGLVITDG
jgi:hypothetical protein